MCDDSQELLCLHPVDIFPARKWRAYNYSQNWDLSRNIVLRDLKWKGRRALLYETLSLSLHLDSEYCATLVVGLEILLYCRFVDHYIWILLAQHEQLRRNHSVLEHNHSMCPIKSVLESFEVRNVELTTNCRKVFVSWTHVCLVKKAREVFPARRYFGWWEHLEKPPTPCDMKTHMRTQPSWASFRDLGVMFVPLFLE